jgi:hypothetical protein
MTLVKYAVPLLSIGIGFCVNYFATRAIGRIAAKHMQSRTAQEN